MTFTNVMQWTLVLAAVAAFVLVFYSCLRDPYKRQVEEVVQYLSLDPRDDPNLVSQLDPDLFFKVFGFRAGDRVLVETYRQPFKGVVSFRDPEYDPVRMDVKVTMAVRDERGDRMSYVSRREETKGRFHEAHIVYFKRIVDDEVMSGFKLLSSAETGSHSPV